MGEPRNIIETLRRRRFAVLLVLWCLINLLVPFDRKFMSSLLNLAAFSVLYGAWALVWEGSFAVNRKVLLRSAVAYALLFLVGFLRAVLPDKMQSQGVWDAVCAVLSEKPRHSRELIEAPLLAVLSVLIYLKTREKARSCGEWKSAYRQFAALFPLIGVFFYLSALLGRHPGQSLYLFAREGGLYIPLCQILFLWMDRLKTVRPALLPLCAAGLAFSLGVAGVYFAATTGSEETREWLAKKEWIRWDATPSDTHLWRVQFPFEHHNRMASYFLLVFFSVPALFAQRKRGARSLLFQILALLPLFAILASKTRGAYVALAAGLLVTFLAAGNWRKVRSWAIPLAGCAALFLLPAVRRQTLSMFRAETYTRPGSTLYLRYAGWRAGCAMIADHPFLGIGYGSKAFVKVYQEQYQRRYNDPETKPHAHNNFIEVAAESGLPALALFAWLNGLIAWELWKKRKVPGNCYRPALLGLLAAIHAYGMANYNLRQGIGFLLWALLAVLAFDALEEKPRGPDAETDSR